MLRTAIVFISGITASSVTSLAVSNAVTKYAGVRATINPVIRGLKWVGVICVGIATSNVTERVVRKEIGNVCDEFNRTMNRTIESFSEKRN